MKVCLELPTQSRGIGRVYNNLLKYAPSGVSIVKDPMKADLTILHVIGRHNQVETKIKELKAAGKEYAMIQYCLKSTMNPDVNDWIDMWAGSKLVWSYYDLFGMWTDVAPINIDFPDNRWKFPFMYAPLGVDTDVFYDRKDNRDFIISANSQHALSESARECAIATQRVNKRMFFLGHELRREGVLCKKDITDSELAEFYSKCSFVSGLRRDEGFELPVIEGLMCGARPIVFDRPEMRKWFGEFAIFIPEGNREEVVDSLESIFRTNEMREPVSEEEKALAKERFNWQTIISEFWRRIL